MTQPEPKANQPRTVKSVGTSCRIIDALVELDGAGVTELADHLDVSKGSIHTHLVTLQEHEYVIKEGDTYRPSFRFLEIGERMRRKTDLVSIAKPELDDLAETTGNRAHLAIEENGQTVLLYEVAGPNALASSSYLGRRTHLHCTSCGKAIFANLPRERIDAIIEEHGLPKYTENTITDRETMLEELEEIRDEGIAYSNGEKVKGLKAIAAPVMDDTDAVIGGISVVTPLNDGTNDSTDEVEKLVKKAANVIEVNNQIQSRSIEQPPKRLDPNQ